MLPARGEAENPLEKNFESESPSPGGLKSVPENLATGPFTANHLGRSPVEAAMNTKTFVGLLAVGAALLAPTARAQVDLAISADIRLGRTPPPPPPEVVVIDNSPPPGPPPWASAYGFRRNREYYYYPAADVYYRPADHMWFYLDGRTWRVDVNLPTSIRIEFDHCVPVTLRTDRPYDYAEKIRAYYPRDYFVTRVRLKERPGRPEHRDHDRGDDHEDDRNRGRGHGHDRDKDKDRDGDRDR